MAHKHPVNKDAYDGRSKSDERVDAFVRGFGSLKFLLWQTVMIVCWLTWNSLNLAGVIHFDKYPFILLNLMFSTQAAYAAPLILLSQNRTGEIDRMRAEHDYEVNQEALDLSRQAADGVEEIKKHLSIQ